jgi:alpha-glucosidase
MKHHIGMHDEIHNIYGLTWDKVVKEQFEKEILISVFFR